MRLKHFFPNRKREVTALAPTSAADLMKLMPGSPVTISSTGENYWITELKVSTPPLTMQMSLVYPANPWDGDLPSAVQQRRVAPPTMPGGTTVDLTNFPTGNLP